MALIDPLLFFFLSLLVIDQFLMLASRTLRSGEKNLHLGIVRGLILTFNASTLITNNKIALIKKFFLAWFFLAVSVLANMYTLDLVDQEVLRLKNSAPVLLTFFCLPFVHFLFAQILNSDDYIFKSFQQLKFRTLLSFTLIFNLTIIQLYQDPSLIFVMLHGVIAFYALSYLAYIFCEQRRAPMGLDQAFVQNNSFGLTQQIYILASLFELLFYFLCFYGALLKNLVLSHEIFRDIKAPFEITMLVLILLSSLSVKLFFYNKNPGSYKFLMRQILPASYLIFVLYQII